MKTTDDRSVDLTRSLKSVKDLADSIELVEYVSKDIEASSKRSETEMTGAVETSYSVRVIKNKKMGVATFYNIKELEKKTKLAITLSKYSEQLDVDFPSKPKSGSVKWTKSCDKRIETGDEEDVDRMLKDMHSTIDKKTEILESKMSIGCRTISIANTNRVDLSETRTWMSASVAVKVKKGKGVSEEDEDSRFIFDTHDLGKKASENALSQEGARGIRQGKYRVVFDRYALNTLLVSMLGSFFNGSSAANNQTLLYDKLGERIFSDKFSMTDAPFEKAINSRSFDFEGTPTREKELVSEGIVKNFLFNLEWLAKARKKKLKNINSQTVGNAGGMTNIRIDTGDVKDLTAEGDVLLVKSFMGSHSLNTSNGEFGIVVDTGFYLKDGEIVHPVNGATINANMIELFRAPILENKVLRISNIISPRIGFENVNCV